MHLLLTFRLVYANLLIQKLTKANYTKNNTRAI